MTISEMGFVDPFYPYYDSKLLKKRSPHVPLGRLEKDIAEYQKLGVRILGVYPPCLQGEVYENHPEWRRIATEHHDDPPDRHEEVSARRDALPAGPLRRLLHRRPGRDPHACTPTSTPSASTACTTAASATARTAAMHFARTPATEIPNADMNDPAFRRYQHWADRRMEDLVRRMQDAAQGDQARRRARHLDHQRRPVRPFPDHSRGTCRRG